MDSVLADKQYWFSLEGRACGGMGGARHALQKKGGLHGV